MRKSIVAVVLAVGAALVPAAPAVASHCDYPYVDPARDPVGFVRALPKIVEYQLCVLSH